MMTILWLIFSAQASASTFVSAYSGYFCEGSQCEGSQCVTGHHKPGTEIFLIGSTVCKGRIESNFLAKDKEEVIAPFKASVVSGCSGKFEVAVVSDTGPVVVKKVDVREKKDENGSVNLTYGKSCAVTDRPFIGSYQFFSLDGTKFVFGTTTCRSGGCGDSRTVIFDLENCKLVLNDSTFGT